MQTVEEIFIDEINHAESNNVNNYSKKETKIIPTTSKTLKKTYSEKSKAIPLKAIIPPISEKPIAPDKATDDSVQIEDTQIIDIL
jgi:hypothetical protein